MRDPLVVAQAARRQGQLPAETNQFVGRETELVLIDALLRGDARLVTLVGPGGVGKTRVAFRAAATAASRYSGGVCLVELSALHDPGLLAHTVASRLGLPEQRLTAQEPTAQELTAQELTAQELTGQELTGQRDALRDALLAQLRELRLLLILDTCEHLIDACAELAEAILAEAPHVTVLATSREPLNVSGETTFPVRPLPVPRRQGPGGGTDSFGLPLDSSGRGEPAGDPDTAPETGADSDAVRLFALRAAAAVPGFAITDANRGEVIRLCRGLEGIPLTIELAAGRLRTLSLAELNSRLDRRLSLLTGGNGGPGDRHATARNAVSWSYDACTQRERALWARLSVFPGSFDASAVHEVCASGELSPSEIFETIIALVDKSVLIRVEGTEGRADAAADRQPPRFRMLDTIREYGAERLAASGDEAAIRNRHLARYLAMARYVDEHVFDDEQLERFGELRREHASIRAALEYSLDGPPGQYGRERDGAELAARLWAYWLSSGLMVEADYWLGKAIDRVVSPCPERARALVNRCLLAAVRGAAPEAIAGGRAGIELAASLQQPLIAARGYAHLCAAYMLGGELDAAAEAAKTAERMLSQAGDQVGLIVLDSHLVVLYQTMGEPTKAITYYQRGIARFAADSAERMYHGYLHVTGGLTYFLLPGRETECAKVLSLALMAKYDLEEILGTAYALEVLGWLAARSGRHQRAAWLLGAADPLWTRCGSRLGNAAAWEQQHQDSVLAIRTALGADACADTFDAGARHPLDQVVALAVNDADTLGDRLPGAAHPGVLTLTDREREIASLAAAGLSAEQVARQLFMSSKAVEDHLGDVFRKLGVSSAAQLGPWLGEGMGQTAP